MAHNPFSAKDFYEDTVARRGLPQGAGKTYWDDPKRIARYYWYKKALPEGQTAPDWIPQNIDAAYDYLLARNNGKPWYMWDNLAENDPITPEIRSWQEPPELAQYKANAFSSTGRYDYKSPYDYLRSQQAQQAQTAATTPTEYTPTELEQANNPFGLDNATWNNLEWYKKLLIPAMTTGAGQIATGALQAGIPALLAGGPIAGAVGTVTGGVAGGLASLEQKRAEQMGTEYEPGLAGKTLNALDWAFRQSNNLLGFITQIGMSIEAPEKYGDLNDLFSDLYTNWNAGQAFYASMGVKGEYSGGAINGERIYGPKETTGFERMFKTPDEDYYNQRRSELQTEGGYFEVDNLYTPGQTRVDLPAGESPLTYGILTGRALLKAGYSPLETQNELMNLYGLGGQGMDLLAGLALDPLNFAGDVTKGATVGIAKLAKNAPLEAAAKISNGPIDTLRNYGTILRTGAVPGTPTAVEIGKMDGFTRWLAGVDTEGKSTILDTTPATGVVGKVKQLFNLTPKAKANEYLAAAVTNLQLAVQGADTADEVMGMIGGLARVDIDKASELSKSLPWMESPEGAALPMSIRDFFDPADMTRKQGDPIKSPGAMMLDTYKKFDWNRGLINKMAADLGTDAVTIMKNIRDDAKGVLSQWTERLTTVGDAESKHWLDLLNQVKFDDEKLSRAVWAFDNGIAFSVDEFKGQVMSAMIDHIDKWAATYFNIKPDPVWSRLASAVKSAQSSVLLGLNPTYLVNNAINNAVTMAWGGVFGVRTNSQIKAFWDEMGVTPPRLRQGVGMADMGDNPSIGKAIREAGTDKGMLQKFSDFFQTGWRKKAQVFATASQSVERMSRAQATTAGTMQAWNRVWPLAYDPLPSALKSMLDKVDPGLAPLVESAIAGSRTPETIDALWENASRMTVDAAIPDILPTLKAGGIDIDAGGVRDILQESGVYGLLTRELPKAKDADAANAVFNMANETIQRKLEALMMKNLPVLSERAMSKVIAEGASGALEMMDRLHLDLQDFWMKHFADLEESFRAGENMPRNQRAAVIRAQMDAADREWNIARDREAATLSGIFRAFGGDNVQIQQLEHNMLNIRDVWGTFYADRRRMLDEFFNAEYETKAERSTAWKKLNEALDAAYGERIKAEEALQADTDAILSSLFDKQFPGKGGAASAWRKGIRDVRGKMAETMRAFRKSAVDMTAPERNAAWGKFLREKYQPAIKEYTAANLDKARGMYGIETGTKPSASPIIQRATIAEMRTKLAQAGIGSETAWLDSLRELNAHLDPGDAPFTDLDYNVTPSKEWLAKLDKAVAKATEANGKAPEPVAVIPMPERAQEIAAQVAARERVKMFAGQHTAEVVDGDQVRSIMRESLIESGWNQRDVDGIVALWDAKALMWAQENGKSVYQWYADTWGGSMQGAGELGQSFQQSAKGAVSFLDDGRAVFHALEAPDFSTLVHETGHVFRRQLKINDIDVYTKYLDTEYGVKVQYDQTSGKFSGEGEIGVDKAPWLDQGKTLDVESWAEEMFARGFERYLRDGNAPSYGLRKLFRQFKDWLKEIYRSVRGSDIDVKMTAELRGIFDRMFTNKVDRPVADMVDLVADYKGDKAKLYKDLFSRQRTKKFAEMEAQAHVAKQDRVYFAPDGRGIDWSVMQEAIDDMNAHPELDPYANAPQVKVKTREETLAELNSGHYAPREKMAEVMDIPQVVADRVSQLLADYAQNMRANLPTDNAVVTIKTDEGGYRQSQNPEWYQKLYDSYKQQGKTLSKQTVFNALDRIIGGTDEVKRVDERTLFDVKDRVWNFMLSEMEHAKPEGVELPESLIIEPLPRDYVKQGDMRKAALQLRKWLMTDIAKNFTEADWAKLTGSEDGFDKLFDYDVDSDLPGDVSADAIAAVQNGQHVDLDTAARVGDKATILRIANEYGVPTATKDGRPMDRAALNIINKRQPEGQKYNSLGEVPPEVAESAFRDHKWKAEHPEQKVEPVVEEPAPEVKKPAWEMTRAEWEADYEKNPNAYPLSRVNKEALGVIKEQAKAMKAGEELPYTPEQLKQASAEALSPVTHKAIIKNALREGREVPASVLAEYPDLAPAETVKLPELPTKAKPLFQSSRATETPEFKRWFGDSKVVDENGNAKVVYHGSQNKFEVFDFSKLGTNGFSEGVGFYFTDNKGIANGYDRGTGNTYEVYLSIKKPMDLTQKKITKQQLRKMFLEIHKLSEANPDEYAGLSNYGDVQYEGLNNVLNTATNMEFQNATDADMIASIINGGAVDPETMNKIVTKVTGYDGVITKWEHTDPPSTVYVAFSPEQIKSVDNTGTFDPNNPNIYYQSSKPSITVEPIQRDTHGNYAIVGNVYATVEGKRKLIAYMPEKFSTGQWQDSVNGQFRIIGLDPNDADKWVIEFKDGHFDSISDKGAQVDAINAPLGALDQIDSTPPIAEAMNEGIPKYTTPILRALQERMTRPDAVYSDKLKASRANLDPVTRKALNGYIATVKGQMSSAKLAAVRMGEMKADYALLNYNHRTNFDTFLTAMVPYEFWGTRTLMNWATRFIDKPAILSNYARVRNLMNRYQRDGLPTRLKNKLAINMDWLLPDEMGDYLYINAYRQIFPWEQFYKPFEMMSKDQNTLEKRATQIVSDWVEQGTITEDQATVALQKTGADWERALDQATSELSNDLSDPFDVMSTILSPNLLITSAYNAYKGKEQSSLPITRFVQGIAGLFGKDVNLEAPLRKLAGESVSWPGWQINRELSNMVGDGTLEPDEAVKAMIDKSGDVYDQAKVRVGKQQGIKTLLPGLLADLYPEGEQTQRQLADEYSKAINAKKSGDTDAVTKFFDAHPGYEARMASFQEPEECLRGFLRGQIWDRYNQLSSIEKKAVQEGFGANFTDAFLNKETRSYDVIDTDTLASWAKTLGGMLPDSVTAASMNVNMPEKTTVEAVDKFYADRDRLFPGVSDKLKAYYESDGTGEMDEQMQEYTNWKNHQLADNPSLIEHLTSEENELSGIPTEIAQYVYKYRAEKDDLFPNIYDVQTQYFALTDTAQKKAFRNSHPELAAYWQFRKEQAALYPKAAPYILGDESLSGYILGDESTSKTGATSISYTKPSDYRPPFLTPSELTEFDDTLKRQLMAYYYGRHELGTGALQRLRSLQKQFKIKGDLDEFLDLYVKTAIMR